MNPSNKPRRKVEFRPSELSVMEEEREMFTPYSGSGSTEYNTEDISCEHTPEGQMKRGLFAVSRQPARPSDIKSFQNLHNPRLHGMAEWILQYESVCRRQELYLQQIKELRQQLRARTGDRPHKATIKHIDSKNAATVNNCHWGPSRLPLFKSDSKSPHQVCVLHPRRKHQLNNSHKDFWQPRDFSLQQQGVATDFLMAPRSLNRADISRRHARQPVKAPVRLPPIEELDRNKTDYEPIEFIAKRNKLNLGKYLREGQTWSRITPRETIDMSDVYVQSTKII